MVLCARTTTTPQRVILCKSHSRVGYNRCLFVSLLLFLNRSWSYGTSSIQTDESLRNDSGDSIDWPNELGANLEPHPDPNDEHYDNMVYVGRHDEEGKRMGFDVDNTVRYIFGTSFDETHRAIEEADLLHAHADGDDTHRNVADLGQVPLDSTRASDYATDQEQHQALFEQRHRKVDRTGPKSFGYVETHPLDGGVVPPKVVAVRPFFMDTTLVTYKEFAKFVKATYYETEAEQFGWSFVLESFAPNAMLDAESDPEASHWIAVNDAYWRRPEGPDSSYKFREHHPVTHVSHRDAAEYCQWVGKRLPGEREWEAAARAAHWGPRNRTLFAWGDDSADWKVASQYANLWGNGTFPWDNKAEDNWRGTSPVKTFPPNVMGFYDMTGNVWEWMRGGKHKSRIVRGASYVDSLDGSFNHAATLGARATLHGTTTTGNVGFRCVKSPKQRTEYHYISHDENVHGQLTIEDQFGHRDTVPQRGWEDQFHRQFMDNDDDEFEEDDERPSIKRKKVTKRRERISTEL